MLTQERVKELFDYDPETGILTRKITVSNQVAGKQAGYASQEGYRDIGIDRKSYRIHRIIWLYIYGEFPPDQIDHINRIRNDNRLANLRLSSCAKNPLNKGKYRCNSSGHTGVSWHRTQKKWQAGIRKNGKQYYLGIFANIEDAIAARKAAERKYDFDPNHGK